MEGLKRLTAQEELRLKLHEYLAAKGKLKSQENCKPYLKDCTNLQNKKPQESSKQICEKKKHASIKGSHFASESNKDKTSNAGSLPLKSLFGKNATLQTVPANRPVTKTSSRKPLPPKCSLPSARPEQSNYVGRTLPAPSVPKAHARKQGRSERSDVTLTVILTKKHGEKPDICVMGKTSSTMTGQPGLQPKKREQSISQSKQMPATKAMTQATKAKRLPESKSQPPAGKPPSVASSGHIRIVSRLSLPEAKSTNKRSFLINSSRNDSAKRVLNAPKDHSRKMTFSTKHSAAAHVTSSTTMVHKKVSNGPVSAPKIRPHSSDCASNRQNTHFPNKQVAPRKSAGLAGCNKSVDGSKDECNKKNMQQGVTCATKEAATKPSLLTTADTTTRPQTPRMTAEDRKKKLEEWLNSKRKTYKRPSMILPPKRPPTAKKQNPCNRSLWDGIEEEEELLSLSNKIRQTLSQCLELIEKGVSGKDIHAALDNIPKAKKFAKYWVCKARLLERDGVYDVIDMYKQGVQFGATPIDELRDVVFDIMKNKSKKTKVVTFGPLPAEEVMENENHEDIPSTPFTNRTEEVKTLCTGASLCDNGSAMKLQITSLSSKKNPGSGQEWKRLTPVRRSVRIHHSASQYPEVVQEHDTVVSSLDELLDKADTDAYLYMRNEALPEEAEHEVIGLVRKDPTEDEQEGPV